MVDTQHNSYSSSQGKIGIRLLIYYMWSTFMYGAETWFNVQTKTTETGSIRDVVSKETITHTLD